MYLPPLAKVLRLISANNSIEPQEPFLIDSTISLAKPLSILLRITITLTVPILEKTTTFGFLSGTQIEAIWRCFKYNKIVFWAKESTALKSNAVLIPQNNCISQLLSPINCTPYCAPSVKHFNNTNANKALKTSLINIYCSFLILTSFLNDFLNYFLI